LERESTEFVCVCEIEIDCEPEAESDAELASVSDGVAESVTSDVAVGPDSVGDPPDCESENDSDAMLVGEPERLGVADLVSDSPSKVNEGVSVEDRIHDVLVLGDTTDCEISRVIDPSV
jgi:hypothetical protein